MTTAVTEILDTVHHLGLKAHNVSEAVETSFFRWNREREEPTLVGLLENVSLGIGRNIFLTDPPEGGDSIQFSKRCRVLA
jgi:hypothetical protein